MEQKVRIRATVFMVVFILLFAGISFIFQPVWLEWSNYDTTFGFYEEEPNTIETIFLGTSGVVTGISPMEIYENNGICSYNLGTEQQPILASYYWLQEAYRLHSDTLKTVVFDVSSLRRAPSEAFYHKALDAMDFSSIKYHAVLDHTGGFWDAVEYLIPLLSYHDRWGSLGKDDFEKIGYQADSSIKGYEYSNKRYLDTKTEYRSMYLPAYIYNEKAEASVFPSDNFSYLEKMVEFCLQNDLQLVLFKSPTSSWSSSAHKSVQIIADHYGLDFMDFNFEPLINEIEFQSAMDTFDNGHMNYRGAAKVSRWFGDYLQSKCGGTDVRKEPEYASWNQQMEPYHRKTLSTVWEDISDPCDYIENLVSEGDYTILIMAKEEASAALTEEQRGRFTQMGLSDLGSLGNKDSYLAVIEDGAVIYEKKKESPDRIENEGDSREQEEIDNPSKELTIEDIVADEDGKDHSLLGGG